MSTAVSTGEQSPLTLPQSLPIPNLYDERLLRTFVGEVNFAARDSLVHANLVETQFLPHVNRDGDTLLLAVVGVGGVLIGDEEENGPAESCEGEESPIDVLVGNSSGIESETHRCTRAEN